MVYLSSRTISYLNGKKLGYFPPDTYIPFRLEAGSYKFKVAPSFNYDFLPKLEIDVDVQSNKTQYIEYDFYTKDVNSRTYRWVSEFKELTEDEGLSKISSCQIQTDIQKKLQQLGYKI